MFSNGFFPLKVVKIRNCVIKDLISLPITSFDGPDDKAFKIDSEVRRNCTALPADKA